jgi:hypothetical protein
MIQVETSSLEIEEGLLLHVGVEEVCYSCGVVIKDC